MAERNPGWGVALGRWELASDSEAGVGGPEALKAGPWSSNSALLPEACWDLIDQSVNEWTSQLTSQLISYQLIDSHWYSIWASCWLWEV